MKRSSLARKGSTLMEALVSFAILSTTGVFLCGFLYKSPTTQKAWTDSYGHELSAVAVLDKFKADTTLLHTDANGSHWETVITVTKDEDELCYKAISVRNKKDSTKALHYCIYGDTHD